jgi:hypothetical protein
MELKFLGLKMGLSTHNFKIELKLMVKLLAKLLNIARKVIEGQKVKNFYI